MICLLYSLLPLAVALSGALLRNIPLMAATVPVLFLMVRFLPFCRRRENLWMFVFTAVATVPINILLVMSIDLYGIMEQHLLDTVVWCVIVYGVLLSLEELVLGVAARLLWRRQLKLPAFLTDADADDDDE